MIKKFTVRNWMARILPCEESHAITPFGIMVVADGVHRDCKNGKIVEATPKGVMNSLFYPRPSPAKKVADIFTREFPSRLLKLSCEKKTGLENIRNAFESINSVDIRKYNKLIGLSYPPKDYTVNYPAGCTAAVAYEFNNTLYWGYITDCGVAVVSQNGNLTSKTKDEGPGKMGDYSEELKNRDLTWKMKDGREFTRKNFRNNPAESRAVGILNGMSEAMYYVRTGIFPIDVDNSYVLVYSDGIGDILFPAGDIDGEAAVFLRKNDISGLERFCKKNIQTEGSLIIKKGFSRKL